MESYEHVSAPRDHHTTSQVTPSGPNTPQLSPRLPKESASQPPSATAGAQALGVQYEEAPPASTISHDTSSKLAASNAAPGGPTYEPSLEQRATPTFEPRAQEQMVPSGISHDTSSRLAASTGAPGGPTFEPLAQEQTAPASGIGPDMSSRLAGSTGAPGGPTFEFGTNEHGGLSEGQQVCHIFYLNPHSYGGDRGGGGGTSLTRDRRARGGGQMISNVCKGGKGEGWGASMKAVWKLRD